MSQPAITVSPDDTVRHAAWLMYDRRVERLPVVDGADRLAGIVSRTDVLTVYSRPDQEICRQITGELLLRELLTDRLSYRVTVREGIVTLRASRKTAAVGHEIVRAHDLRIDYGDDRVVVARQYRGRQTHRRQQGLLTTRRSAR